LAQPLRVVGEGEKRFNIIHAEFFGDDAALDSGQFDSDVRERMLWGRDLVLGTGDPARHALSLTFCGHTPVREVRQIGSQVFIDTGAFITEGRLTMVEAHTSRILSVSQVEALAHGAAAIVLP
jgi:serine/threonine protein phosphatase 1